MFERISITYTTQGLHIKKHLVLNSGLNVRSL